MSTLVIGIIKIIFIDTKFFNYIYLQAILNVTHIMCSVFILNAQITNSKILTPN